MANPKARIEFEHLPTGSLKVGIWFNTPEEEPLSQGQQIALTIYEDMLKILASVEALLILQRLKEEVKNG